MIGIFASLGVRRSVDRGEPTVRGHVTRAPGPRDRRHRAGLMTSMATSSTPSRPARSGGVSTINISLNTLDPAQFTTLTAAAIRAGPRRHRRVARRRMRVKLTRSRPLRQRSRVSRSASTRGSAAPSALHRAHAESGGALYAHDRSSPPRRSVPRSRPCTVRSHPRRRCRRRSRSLLDHRRRPRGRDHLRDDRALL